MKRIILMRHGDYEGQFLTESGQKVVGMMGEKLNSLLVDWSGSVKTVSSTSMRAVRSAHIIAEKLELPFGRDDQHECLKAEREDVDDLEGIAGLIDQTYSEVDTLIAVTHAPVCGNFPWFYANIHGLGPWPDFRAQYSEYIIMDLEANTSKIYRFYQ